MFTTSFEQLERMGEWSPENVGGRWVTGDGTNVGDQFEGDNKRGDREWSVIVTVNAATPGTVYAFHTGPADSPYVQWTYDFEPSAAGTKVSETWDVVKLSPFLESAPPDYAERRRPMVEADIATTLANLKSSIEA